MDKDSPQQHQHDHRPLTHSLRLWEERHGWSFKALRKLCSTKFTAITGSYAKATNTELMVDRTPAGRGAAGADRPTADFPTVAMATSASNT